MPVFEKPIEENHTNRHYSLLSMEYMVRTIRRYIREHTPGVAYGEDGYPILPPEKTEGLSKQEIYLMKQALTPEEAQTLAEHRQEILDYAVKDKLVIKPKPDPTALDNYIKLQKPGYTPLNADERASREQYSEQLRTKFADYAAKREIVIGLLSAENAVKRAEEALFRVDISDEAIAWNRELARDINSQDPAVKKKAYGRALKRIAEETDLANLDLTDDNYIKDNFEKYYSLLSAGPEIAALIDTYKGLSGDADPELDKQIARLATMEDSAGIMRAKIDVMASSVYSTVRTEDLFGDPKYLMGWATDKSGRTVDPEDGIYPGQEPDDYFISNFKQIVTVNTIALPTSFLDATLTPEERLQRSVDDYKVREEAKQKKAEEARLIKEAKDAEIRKYVNMERMPQGLTPQQQEKRIDYEIQLRKNIATLQQAIRESNEKTETRLREREESIVSRYTEDVLEADTTLTGQEREDRLRSLSEKKNADIQALLKDREEKIVKDISLTEDQIQTYLTPERMALLDRAYEAKKSQDARKEIAGKIKDVPRSFSRVLFASIKDPKEPNAEIHNNYVSKFIANPNYRSQLDRRQLIIDNANAIKELDKEKMSFDRPFNELADYVLNNLDACEIGYEFQNTHRSMDAALGFSEKEEFREYMKNVEDKGVVLGGRGRMVKELLQDDSYMKLPFEHLDGPQMGVMMNSVISNPKEYGITDSVQISNLGKFGTYIGSKESQNEINYTEPDKGIGINHASFEDHLPNPDEIRQQFEVLENKLNQTDHWYNRLSSSEEYRELRSAMEELKGELNRLTTEAGNPEKMHEAEARLVRASESYVNHVGDNPRNNNQKLRAEAAADLMLLVREGLPAQLVRSILKNNAIAKPEEREFYEKVTAPPQKPKPKTAQAESIQQDRSGADAVTQQLKAEGKAKDSDAVKQLYSMLVSARTGLTGALNKSAFNPENVKPMLATAIACQMYKLRLEGGNGIKAEPNMTVVYNNSKYRFSDMSSASAKFHLGNMTIALMESEGFKQAVHNLTEEKLRRFLTGENPERTELMREICGNIAEGQHLSSVGPTSSAINNARQTNEPKKEATAPSK